MNTLYADVRHYIKQGAHTICAIYQCEVFRAILGRQTTKQAAVLNNTSQSCLLEKIFSP